MNHRFERPFSAFQFQLLIAPTLARVLIEVQDCLPGDIHVRERVEWEDSRVVAAFCKLVNLSPEEYLRLQRTPKSLSEQNHVILRARDVREGLWHADEVAQLDGQAALDFTLGWMGALDWIQQFPACSQNQTCSAKSCPTDVELHAAIEAAQAQMFPASPDNFKKGFMYLVKLRVGTPGQCSLQRVQFVALMAS